MLPFSLGSYPNSKEQSQKKDYPIVPYGLVIDEVLFIIEFKKWAYTGNGGHKLRL